MTKYAAVIIGEDAKKAQQYLGFMLFPHWQVLAEVEDHLTSAQPNLVLVAQKNPLTTLEEKEYKRFFRKPQYRKAVIIAPGSHGQIRKLLRNFAFKFRWISETKVWPGLESTSKDQALFFTYLAKTAHEMGASPGEIKDLIAKWKTL